MKSVGPDEDAGNCLRRAHSSSKGDSRTGGENPGRVLGRRQKNSTGVKCGIGDETEGEAKTSRGKCKGQGPLSVGKMED